MKKKAGKKVSQKKDRDDDSLPKDSKAYVEFGQFIPPTPFEGGTLEVIAYSGDNSSEIRIEQFNFGVWLGPLFHIFDLTRDRLNPRKGTIQIPRIVDPEEYFKPLAEISIVVLTKKRVR